MELNFPLQKQIKSSKWLSQQTTVTWSRKGSWVEFKQVNHSLGHLIIGVQELQKSLFQSRIIDQWSTLQTLADLPLNMLAEKKSSNIFKQRNWTHTVEDRPMGSFLCLLEEVYLQFLCSGHQLTQSTDSLEAVCMLKAFWTLASFMISKFLWFIFSLGYGCFASYH